MRLHDLLPLPLFSILEKEKLLMKSLIISLLLLLEPLFSGLDGMDSMLDQNLRLMVSLLLHFSILILLLL